MWEHDVALCEIKKLWPLTSCRKAAQGWEKTRTMQTYFEGGVQNNQGWVSVLYSTILCLKCLWFDPYPALKQAFPVVLSQTHIVYPTGQACC